jgi:DNA helicase-2/ATP-dependent DNA helicase PcrA
MTWYIEPERWHPLDNLELEKPGAVDAVKSDFNCYVVAGPGAGKTELLAQRAGYLLQTGLCAAPQKILALSYKRDARRAIEERVRQRVGREFSRRFITMTYAGFAKSLVDRFRLALPEGYCPIPDYQVILSRSQLLDTYEKLRGARNLPRLARDYLVQILETGIDGLPPRSDNAAQVLIGEIWQLMLTGDPAGTSYLNFPMIAVLAEYLVRLNTQVKRALNATYSHVLLDEFQDTTTAQYRLLKTCFWKQNTVLTAVGDRKQRIMIWAGADREVFQKFERDFHVVEKKLLMNYRSAPKLVAIQRLMAQKITGEPFQAKPAEKWNEDDGICEVWLFNTPEQEAAEIRKNVETWLVEENLRPRQLCVLVRQRVDIYGKQIFDALKTDFVSARNEDLYQDLLEEECSRIILDVLSLALSDSGARTCADTIRIINLAHGIDANLEDYAKLRRIEVDFRRFLVQLRHSFDDVDNNDKLEQIFWKIIKYVGLKILKNVFPQYKRGDYLKQVLTDLSGLLWQEYSHCSEWGKAVASLKGEYSIPVMTIHKSKGLEYDTVVFLGLEDDAFWNYARRSDEEMCNFFVALSRAMRRVIFTFSMLRENVQTSSRERQSWKKIHDLYDVLGKSQVAVIKDLRQSSCAKSL